MPDPDTRTFPVFTAVAEHSLLVELGATIDDATTARIHALDRALTAAPFAGFVEAVPAYAAILVRFDPLTCDHAIAEAAARAALDRPSTRGEGRTHEVAVCYDGDLGADLDAVAGALGMDREAVIAAHLAGHYAVAMYGFAPGYAYLAGVDARLHLPRKPAPVRAVPAGTVLIAGAQCIVSTLTMPTGWWRIGTSTARILTGDPARPFLFDVGDAVRFRRITRSQIGRGA